MTCRKFPFSIAAITAWTLLLHALLIQATAQTTISGRVITQNHEGVPFASVFVAGTYLGTVCDDSGYFRLDIPPQQKIRLGASSIGLETAMKEVDASASLFVTITLKESYATLQPVTITAGQFAAGDQGRAELLKPRDMGTTAGAPGDIQATIEALPGTQRVGYTEGLFVRGGSDRESQYIMDGLIYPHPYYSHVPTLKQHGRLDPFLFSGTVFSSGGYSAQYGQALSSVLILNSKGLADSTLTGGGLHSYGGNIFHTHRFENTSLHVNAAYNNMQLHHHLSDTRTRWTLSPINRELRIVFRTRTSPHNLFKAYATVSDTRMGILMGSGEPLTTQRFDIDNVNALVNTGYTHHLKNEKTTLMAGVSASGNADRIRFSGTRMHESGGLGQARVTLRHHFQKESRLIAGGEYLVWRMSGSDGMASSVVTDRLGCLFAEAESTLRNVLALRVGMRAEYSSYSEKANWAPRTSLAWKFSPNSQVSFSYGVFYQQPGKTDMLYHPSGLDPERARHVIVNYQYGKNERTLRVELFHKQYSGLVTTYFPQENYRGQSGYARGAELFFRDRASIGNLDWWISYSLTDSRRKTLVPGAAITPEYVSAHSLALVAKYWIPFAGVLFSTSCVYATPRKYSYSDTENEVRQLDIPAFMTLDISFSRPLRLARMPAMLFCSWQNITGYDKLLGYIALPHTVNPLQVYRSEKRTFFIGLFIHMYND